MSLDPVQSDRQSPAWSSASTDREVHYHDHIRTFSPRLPAMLFRLPPREREIATIVYLRGMLSANETRNFLSRPLSNSAVRTMLARLEAKGILRKRPQGKRFLYGPAISSQAARECALQRVADDFFGGSLRETASTLAQIMYRS